MTLLATDELGEIEWLGAIKRQFDRLTICYLISDLTGTIVSRAGLSTIYSFEEKVTCYQ